MHKLVVCCFLLSVPASVLSQSSPRVVSEVHVSTPKPGMTAQWEAGRKAHSAFHAAQKDTWPIFTWQIMTGERSGSYMTATPGRHWSDYDARQAFLKIDAPDIAKNLAPYLASTSMSYYVLRDDLSLSKPPATPAMMRTSTYYTVIPEHANDFTAAIKKINEAVQKANYSPNPSRWYALANGGETPTFVQVTDRSTWAAMEPPEKTLEAVLKDAYGDSGPQALDQLRRSCSKIVTDLLVYRPDLSYIPK
jgi:hypothetical protein